MTKENKELLLKDLCARLPDNCRVFYEYVDDLDGRTYGYSLTLNTWCIDEFIANKAVIKPYLRPLLSMTEEEKKIIADKCGFSFKGPVGGKIDLVMSVLAVDWLIDFYNKNHFDYRGLIEKGLAIAVTEENNPYKE